MCRSNSELNEGSDILSDELRRAIRDVICCSGTPDDGFRISFADAAGIAAYDFSIDEGTYYIGGVRYDMLADCTFLTQPDWLQITLDLQPLPTRPATQPGGDIRYDFVYLEGWEQEVSATEDSELFERALAGADGAGRRRRMARIRTITGTADSCVEAMEAAFPEDGFDPDTCALVSGAGITVDFDNTEVDDNLCAPQVQTGFLGAENETFRVQLTAQNRFIYGRDNASHLHRVTFEAVPGNPTATPPLPDRTRVIFLTRPRDAHSQPLAGQTVELFRWNTLLPNGEKLAEPIGTLANIATDYDPASGTILIDWQLDTDWVAWFGAEGASAINPMDGGENDEYFYLRIWTGGSGDAVEPDHPIPDSSPVAMSGTGLRVAFANTGTPNVFGTVGDFWVIAARPFAPDVVTPWRLLDASPQTPPPAPPMGPMRHIAPLALITWAPDNAGNYQPEVHDCRERFRKLCKIGTCCEITVGDGEHSHGDVDSIGEAVARLPSSGGKICLLRGHHEASIDLDGKNNITFCGCGAETVWTALPGSPAVTLTGCTNIRFDNFVMQADDTDVVLAGSRTGETPAEDRSKQIAFDAMIVLGRDRSALWLNDCDEVRIERCRFVMRSLSEGRTENSDAGQDPALFLLGADVTVERCHVGPDDETAVDVTPLCGVQIGGMSKHVTLRRNCIMGGQGNGITLGHLEWISELVPGATGTWTLGSGWYVNDAGCLVPWIYPIPPETGTDEVLTPVSGGEICHLVIEDNEISKMGRNGIAVCHFFDLSTNEDFITIDDCRITGNLIRGCLTSDIGPPPPEVSYFMSFGGIALGNCDLISIRGNRIRDNGVSVRAPTCGIFILTGAGIEIDENKIYANGAAPGSDPLPLGRRGGVNIGWCLTYASPRPSDGSRSVPARMEALSMSGNFIDSSHGQALKVVALGPVRVTGNRLIGAGADPFQELQMIGLLLTITPVYTSLGLVLTSLAVSELIDRQSFANAGALLAELIIAALGGSAVSIFNVAWLEELMEFLLLEGDLSENFGVGGETLFNDNQVSLMPHGSQQATRVSSVLVASMDDVSIGQNQIEVESGGGFVLTNCFAPAATVRMTGNRMQEPVFKSLFSGVSHAVLMNNQSLNQGTMCFLASSLFGFGQPHVQKHANQSLIDLVPIGKNTFCGIIGQYLDELIGATGLPVGEATGNTGDSVLVGKVAWTQQPNYVMGGYPMAYRAGMVWQDNDT